MSNLPQQWAWINRLNVIVKDARDDTQLNMTNGTSSQLHNKSAKTAGQGGFMTKICRSNYNALQNNILQMPK